MWFNILVAVVAAFLFALLGVMSFKAGMQYGVNVFLAGFEAKTGKKVVVNEVTTPKKTRKKADKSETEEQRKRNLLMSNINAYDGSTLGQMEIK